MPINVSVAAPQQQQEHQQLNKIETVVPKFTEIPVSLAAEYDYYNQHQHPSQQHHVLHAEMQQQQQHHQQMYDYQVPMSSGSMSDYNTTITSAAPQNSGHAYPSYSATATGSPYVFINNVTANVNVHHGPAHLQDDQQQQQHHMHHQHQQQQHQMQMHQQQQQRYQQHGQQQMLHQGPPPMAGPPPAALLPTPHFVPAGQQGVPQPGYVAPFPNQQKVGPMYQLPPMYSFVPFAIPPYGFPPQMMPQMPQGPQSMPRAAVPILRTPAPLTPGHLFTPPPMVGPVAMPEMSTAFPGPPPMPVIVSSAPVLNVSQPPIEQQLHVLPQQQVEVQMEDDVESDERYVDDDKVEVESFGFEIPNEVELQEQEEEELVNVPNQVEADEQLEESDQDDEQVRDAPTPVQDEPVDVIEEQEVSLTIHSDDLKKQIKSRTCVRKLVCYLNGQLNHMTTLSTKITEHY